MLNDIFAKPNSKPKRPSKKKLELAYFKDGGCDICPLRLEWYDMKNPQMEPTGQGEILIIGEAPGEVEDIKGIQFIGKSGKLLRDCIPKSRQWTNENVVFYNAVNCHPSYNRTPTHEELACCFHKVHAVLMKYKPKVVIAVGDVALKWFMPDAGSISSFRGRTIPFKYEDLSFWLCPVHHPAFVLRMISDKKGKSSNDSILSVFEQDIAKAVSRKDIPVFMSSFKNIKAVTITAHSLNAVRFIEQSLEHLKQRPVLAFDFEATGVVPYEDGFKVLSLAIGDEKEIISFTVDHPLDTTPQYTKGVLEVLRSFLLSYEGTLVAHYLIYDLLLLYWLFPTRDVVRRVYGCTYSQAYCLDMRQSTGFQHTDVSARRGLLSLDFLAYQHFGYRVKEVTKFDVKNAVEADVHDLLEYNALDVFTTIKLYRVQQQSVANLGLETFYQSRLDAVLGIVPAQYEGVLIDLEACELLLKGYKKRSQSILDDIKDDPNRIAFVNQKRRTFNPASTKDVLELFRDVLGLKKQFSESNSTDESALRKLVKKYNIAQLILDYREVNKVISTYIMPYLVTTKNERIVYDGRVHTNYSPYKSTGRWSSNRPNLQNIPVRSQVGLKIREFFVPDAGYSFVAFDYGQIEFRNIVMASKDELGIKYVWEDLDVHTDMAQKLIEVYPPICESMAKRAGVDPDDEKKVFKAVRQEIKSGIVFSSVYGASAQTCADYLGIPSQIATKVQEYFWYRFSGIKKWQEETLRFYSRYGYVETLTGARLRYDAGGSLLTFNKILNFPIQHLAAVLIGDAMCRCVKEDFRVVLQIHDDITLLVPHNEVEETVRYVAELMCMPSPVYRPWAHLVPLSVEVKVSDQSWGQMKEYGEFKSTEFGHIRGV